MRGIHNEILQVDVDARTFFVDFEAWSEPRLGWSILVTTDRDANVVWPDKEEEEAIDKAIRDRLEELWTTTQKEFANR